MDPASAGRGCAELSDDVSRDVREHAVPHAVGSALLRPLIYGCKVALLVKRPGEAVGRQTGANHRRCELQWLRPP